MDAKDAEQVEAKAQEVPPPVPVPAKGRSARPARGHGRGRGRGIEAGTEGGDGGNSGVVLDRSDSLDSKLLALRATRRPFSRPPLGVRRRGVRKLEGFGVSDARGSGSGGQNGPKTAQNGPKTAQDRPKTAQDRPKMPLGTPPGPPQSCPGGLRDRPSCRTPPGSRFGVDLASIWARFWADLGSILG